MITRLGIEIALNMMTVGVLVEAFFRPPVGFHGPMLYRVIAHGTLIGGSALLGANFSAWLNT